MKPFEEYTIKEVLALGYKVTFEAPPIGNSTGVHYHQPDRFIKLSDEDYDNFIKKLDEPTRVSEKLKKLFKDTK